jgi:uncharacterized protein (TIGR03067 family)
VALTCGLLALTGRADDKPAESDKEKIQGTWVIVEGERGGSPIPPAVAKEIKYVFAGDRVTIQNRDRKTQATFKLNPDKKPKEIDINMDGNVGKGIYELKDDTLKLAHGGIGDFRPRDFPKKYGSGLTVMLLKRAQP